MAVTFCIIVVMTFLSASYFTPILYNYNFRGENKCCPVSKYLPTISGNITLWTMENSLYFDSVLNVNSQLTPNSWYGITQSFTDFKLWLTFGFYSFILVFIVSFWFLCHLLVLASQSWAPLYCTYIVSLEPTYKL